MQNERKKTKVRCFECNSYIDLIVTIYDYIPNYYICPKCTAVYYEDDRRLNGEDKGRK